MFSLCYAFQQTLRECIRMCIQPTPYIYAPFFSGEEQTWTVISAIPEGFPTLTSSTSSSLSPSCVRNPESPTLFPFSSPQPHGYCRGKPGFFASQLDAQEFNDQKSDDATGMISDRRSDDFLDGCISPVLFSTSSESKDPRFTPQFAISFCGERCQPDSPRLVKPP